MNGRKYLPYGAACDNAHTGYVPCPLLLLPVEVHDFVKCSSAVPLSSKYLPTIYEASLRHPSNRPILNFILFTPGSLDIQHFALVVMITLPCRVGGQLADISWQTEVPGKRQFASSAKIALGGWWRMNWTGARNQQVGPVVLLQMQFFVPVHASNAALV